MVHFFILSLFLSAANLYSHQNPALVQSDTLHGRISLQEQLGSQESCVISVKKNSSAKLLTYSKQTMLYTGPALLKMAIKGSLSPLFSAFMSGLFFINFKWLKHKVDQLHEERKIIIDTSFRSRSNNKNSFLNQEDDFVLFHPRLQKEWQNALEKTQKTKKALAHRKKITYSNLLIHGAGNSGKTLFARRLAKASGMNFIVLDGFLLRRIENINAIKTLWNHLKYKKNFMLIIKNGDEMLALANEHDVHNEARNTCIDFLKFLYTKKSDVMLVMTAQNCSAIDIIEKNFDQIITFTKPNYQERLDLLIKYSALLVNTKNNALEKEMYLFDDNYLHNLVLKTEGFSCIDIANLAKSIKMEADAYYQGKVSSDLINDILEKMLQKRAFIINDANNWLNIPIIKNFSLTNFFLLITKTLLFLMSLR